MYVYLNDRLVQGDEAYISVFDHGFLYGDGIYETMRVYDGTVFMLESHLARLRRSASLIQLSIDRLQIGDALKETLAANRLDQAYVRITISRGKGRIGLDPGLCPSPTLVIIAEPFREYPESLYCDGTTVIIAKTQRNSIHAIDPRIKSLNFLNNILAKIEAKAGGAHEAVMLNPDGYIAEGTVSNFFFVKNSTLCTPSTAAGILDGITREVVLSAAQENSIAVSEGMFRPDDLYGAEEIFYTNTTSEVMPVSKVDHICLPVGPVTKKLHELYKGKVRSYLSEHQK